MKQNKLVLSVEEEQLILEKRKKEESKKEESNKARKIGFLKENIYEFRPTNSKYGIYDYFSESEKNNEIEEFKKLFKLTMQAGGRFVCYVDDGKDYWYDCEGFGYEHLNSDWAEVNLTDIQDIK